MKLKPVKLVFRKPFPDSFSIEYLFNNLLIEFKLSNISASKVELPNYSQGLFNRIINLLAISKFPNQIIHVTGDVHYAILGAWKSRRILTIHDLTFMDRHKGLKRYIYKIFWIKLPVLFAHKVTVISEATKKEVLQYTKIREKKIAVIPDFIDSIYQPFTRIFNIKKPQILQIGTAFNKNILRVIESIKEIDCKLVIVGPVENDALALLKQYHIDFENFRNLSLEDLHTKYTESDILIYVSLKEGFGMPILEAQSTGLPVLTSNCSSMPEVAGNGAVFADPLDISSIRNGILTILRDEIKRSELIKNGYKNVERFSKRKITDAYLAIYESMN